MRPRSLRLRLLAGGAVVILVALCIDWLATSMLIERRLVQFEVVGLQREAMQLLWTLHLDAHGMPVVDDPPHDIRFGEPGSGRYWQVRTASGTLRSRSLENNDLPLPIAINDHDWHTRTVDGPFHQNIILLEHHPRMPGGMHVMVQFADDKYAVGVAQEGFSREVFLFLLGLWVILSAAGAILVHFGLRPLARLRTALEALRANPLERLEIADYPTEVEPLMHVINELADARERDLVRARQRAADLAHGLKVPLSVLIAQSRHVRERAGEDIADSLDLAITVARAAVEAELTRARAAVARQSIELEQAPVRRIAEQVVNVIEHTEMGTNLVFEVEIPGNLTLPGGAAGLSEILGALVENAARYARRRIRIAADCSDYRTRLTVEDDGPGLEDWHTQEALIRGHRLDEKGPGHGLGLSIAHDLVEMHGGELRLGRSSMGGLLAEMIWQTPPPPKAKTERRKIRSGAA